MWVVLLWMVSDEYHMTHERHPHVIAGIIVLGDNDNTTRHTVVATLTAILWSLLVIFPFIQVFL